MSTTFRRAAGLVAPFCAFGALLLAVNCAPAVAAPFLTVRAPRVVDRGVPWVLVRTRDRPTVFSARLNRRDVSRTLIGLDGMPRKATLSPSEGLRRGRNVLRVTAGRPGALHRRKVVILVHSRILPAAGRDRTVKAGARVRLGATRSVPRRARPLAYHWRIVQKPKGSQARLRRPRSAHPGLVTDKRGVYRLDLLALGRHRGGAAASARGGGRAGSLVAARDKVEVRATATPPLGLPVTTLEQHNGAYGIEVGNEFYESQETTAPAVQILVFKQATLELVKNTVEPLTVSTSDMRKAICDEKGVVLVQAPPPVAEVFAKNFGEQLECFEKVAEDNYEGGVSMVRAGTDVINWRGVISGYLQQNAVEASVPHNDTPVITHWFRFVPAQYLRYDTQAPEATTNGNTIAIGGAGQVARLSVSERLPDGVFGFQALAVDAQTLRDYESATFATTGGPNDAEGIEKLAIWLRTWTGEPNVRIFLQSIGSPNASQTPDEDAWAAAAKAIESMGGNAHVFNTIEGSYAFVGGPGMGPHSFASAAEASSSLTGKPASLGGVLARDGHYDFSPRLTDPGGELDTRMMTIAFEEPQPWPHPDGSPGEQAAAKWLLEHPLSATEVGTVEELREDYWSDGTFDRDIANYSGKLQCETPPREVGFGATEYEAVCKELEDEMDWVATVTTLLGPPGSQLNGEMQEALLGPQSYEISNDISTNIANQLSNYDPGSAAVTAKRLGFTSDVAWVAEELFPSDTYNPGGLLASVAAVSGDYASSFEGEAADAEVREDADKVANSFLSNSATTAMQFNKLAQIIVSDYGKLKQVGELAGPNGPWKWSETLMTASVNSFTAGAVRWAYRQLLPAKFSAQILVPNGQADDPPDTEPSEYTCIDFEHDPPDVPAFHNPPAQSYFNHHAKPNETDAYWIMLEGNGHPPSAALAEALQSSPTNLYLPWLFQELELKNYDVDHCK
jgi:hypothetical protein